MHDDTDAERIADSTDPSPEPNADSDADAPERPMDPEARPANAQGGPADAPGGGSTATRGDPSAGPITRRKMLRLAGASAGAIAVGSTVLGSASAVSIPTPWLHRDGNLIRDENDNRVILRGVNMPDPARCSRDWRSRDAMEIFDHLTNTDEGWYNRILRVPTQPQDISSAPNDLQMVHGDDWGPLLPGQLTENMLETYFSTYVDPLVDAAEETGMYIMIDYHRHFPIFHQPQNEDRIGEFQCGNESFPNDLGFCGERGVLWHSEEQASQLDGYTEEYAAELDQELRQYWNFVAPRYSDRSHVVYDIFNEPTGPYAGDWGSPTEMPFDGGEGSNTDVTASESQQYWDMWVERAQPWVDVVRSHADRNLITIGSPRWSQYTYWAPTNEFDDPAGNMCYNAHVYAHENLRPFSEYFGSAAEEVPIFMSEFGWAEGGGPDDFDFLDATADEMVPLFEDLFSNYPIHPLCWNFDHTWQPAFFTESWNLQPYQERPGQWWNEYLTEYQDQDLPQSSGDDGTPTDTATATPTVTPTDPPTDTPTDTPTEPPTGDLIASIDPSTTSASTGELVQFWLVDETGGGSWVTGADWDLGNGNSGSGWYADVRYQSAGSYTVTMTATDDEGDQTTDEVTVQVS